MSQVKAHGKVRATSASQMFLDRCEAIIEWNHCEVTDTFYFTYDPTIEVWDGQGLEIDWDSEPFAERSSK